MIAGIGACAFKVSYLDFVFKSEFVFYAAPQITAKTPPNAPEIQEITTTQVSRPEWTILLYFSTFEDNFKISHTFPYMTVDSLGYLWFMPLILKNSPSAQPNDAPLSCDLIIMHELTCNIV